MAAERVIHIGTADISQPSSAIGIVSRMTAARDELRRLVDALPEAQVSRAIAEVTRLTSGCAVDPSWPPPWFGAITADDTDISERIEETLAEGFGR
jgi:hypothetical protein